MAQSEHLPIYKRGYELCLYLKQVVRRLSRGLASHQERGARGGPLEALQVLGVAPRQPAVPADRAITGERGHEDDPRPRSGHTATLKSIFGCGS